MGPLSNLRAKASDRFDSIRYRLLGRCMVCGRRVVLHTPWALYVCERTPLPIHITELGYARLAESEPAAPVSHAASV